eukprot:TRINITY_DN105960_c0_g1_i1.p1 TRINITY_DN105960_c0_g1~~TRINITY_DN105960_c0_g1_i1.p1  ORF type:complete len:299 (-),score=50.06 TRINITY_DN105960_c0_g1_i1:40-903(-)
MDCEGLLTDLTQQVMQERLQAVTTCDPEKKLAEMAMAADEATQTGGRFTSRRMKVMSSPPQQQLEGPVRPGRLAGAIHGAAPDPFSQVTGKLSTVAMESKEPVTVGSGVGEIDDLLAFKHLAQLEDAIRTGSALPDLPHSLATSGRLAPMAGSAAAAGYRPSSARRPTSHQGRTLAEAGSPRVLVSSGAWGLQPQSSTAARRHAAAAAPLGFQKSIMRGTGLGRKGCGAHATALWINNEVERLHADARRPKGIGSSYEATFLVNRGPENIDHISASLTTVQPARASW